MRNVDLIIMGKTGAGKSTLVNAVIGEEVAETGVGSAVTQKNKKYTRQIVDNEGMPLYISVYDTVGLEIDTAITEKTVKEIEKHLNEVANNVHADEVTAVWFCVNWKCNRFENYELDLIKKLSVDRCIPFVIVLTQCIDDSVGDLENSIIKMLPEIPVARILARDYKSRVGVHKAYGLPELFRLTLNEYPRLKVQLAEERISKIQNIEAIRIRRLEIDGKYCISRYTEKAAKAGWIPVLSIPYIHRMRNKMMEELNSIFGLRIGSEKMEAIIVGIIATPFFAIPLLSRVTSEAYVETIGESYLYALLRLAKEHSNYELEKNEIILEEIKKSLGVKKNETERFK